MRVGTRGARADRFGAETLSRGCGSAHFAAALFRRCLPLRRKSRTELRSGETGASMSASALVELTIDGRKVSVPAGTTIFDAARMHEIEIPTLCHQQNEKPVGVCRVCVVDVGARVYTAACIRPVEPVMV